MHRTLTGSINIHEAPSSRFIKGSREIVVYTPPDYEVASGRRYPVLYLQDGQNLFDPATAFLGNHWDLADLMDRLIYDSQVEPLIVVGIYNSGRKRLSEYTPMRDRAGRGGGARNYGRFIVEDLKPFIDSQYRTLPECTSTGLGGSSLGGLAALYLGLKFPDTFCKLIVMSPSVWWADRAILRQIRAARLKPNQKIWLDVGTQEGQNPQAVVDDVILLRDVLVKKGWRPGEDLLFVRDEGAGHNEQAWGRRMRDALQFLFPAH